MAYRRKQVGAAADHRNSYPQDYSAPSYSYTSLRSVDERTNKPGGLWETLARRAKGMMLDEDDGLVHKFEDLRREPPRSSSGGDQVSQSQSRWSFEKNHWKKPGDDDAAARMRPAEALSASVNQLGGRIRNALEEGLTIVDHKTSSIIQETKKIQIRRRSSSNTTSPRTTPNSTTLIGTPDHLLLNHQTTEPAAAVQGTTTQLKASRDVANAMAAKAKLLLRELKSVKADLAFAKQRCAQLEEENKLLRETKQKGTKTEEDDDLIRVQLETLLAEKSRLAQENSTYARENRFLREIVEFHQFTAHDVVDSLADDGDTEDDDDDDQEEEDDDDINLVCTTTSNELHPAVEDNSEHEEEEEPSCGPGDESPTTQLGTAGTASSSPKSGAGESECVADSLNSVSGTPKASASA